MIYDGKVFNTLLIDVEPKVIRQKSTEFHYLQVEFEDDWSNMSKRITFMNGVTKVTDELSESGLIKIPWEVLVETGTLRIAIYGIDNDDESITVNTYMPSPLTVGAIDTDSDGENPADPSPDIYNTLLANQGINKALLGIKTIPVDGWEEVSGDTDIVDKSSNPDIITSVYVTIAQGGYADYLDVEAYPATDFKLELSNDGETTTEYPGTSEGAHNANQRIVVFDLGNGDIISVRIRETEMAIAITSDANGLTYYLHTIILYFQHYFTYEYQVDGLSSYFSFQIPIDDASRDEVRLLSGDIYPKVYEDYVLMRVTQQPTSDILTRYFGMKTDKEIGFAEVLNIYGNSVYRDIAEEITEDEGTKLVTAQQLIDYVAEQIANI